jgi:dihydrofolate reductase
MPSEPRVRVFLAMSLDGFIAGDDDDLSWLPEPPYDDAGSPDALTWERFMDDVGALLMGRGTYDVVRGFDVDWPWGDRPVLVATHRDLDEGAPVPVRRIEGTIDHLVTEAKRAAAGKDVYIDGGILVRQACDAGLVDEMTISIAPVTLGSGHPLFAGLADRLRWTIEEVHRSLGGMVQLRLTPVRADAQAGAGPSNAAGERPGP